MQLQTLFIFGFVLTLACLMNTTSAKSCSPEEVEVIQKKLCRPYIFSIFFMHWAAPCRQLIESALKEANCDCGAGGGNESSTTTTQAAST